MYESPSDATDAVPTPGPSAFALPIHAAESAAASASASVATRARVASVPARPIEAPFDRARDDLPRRPCASRSYPVFGWLASRLASGGGRLGRRLGLARVEFDRLGRHGRGGARRR